ncbi:DNA-directed RNA polymerases I, II, and III subunit RPABC1 [Nosema granulosis]|uniref:DNA-directed RNA polymerases I, II, and III subunit RPABC1 n=1 Tax=Nosema granulosis TaxID=83296 RepID=A0A9P6H059_9MICR|nr:DNA-directed RNA polymerases I, II, and III subunit RPABC1 [Nosema granulosis]
MRSRNLWLSRNTSVEMVLDRGYSTDQKVLSQEDFNSKYPDSCNFVCYDGSTPVAVHFLDQDKIGKSSLETILGDYQRENISRVIFISSAKISPACQSLIHSGIELFLEEEMLFNITKHSLVPKHRILSQTEKQDILSKMRLKPEQMPKILKRDPVCRYLGASTGDVIEINRKSRTAGQSLYYKIVEDKVIKL